jgi:hypothetical protein
MANPTSNFNWQMPTASDLVTDLPADFEVFGQAVDTSLADLKGGTTGQVLSKTSGTDMDFTWVTTDDANAIQNSIVDAKGDLIAASANDTPARLAVGANGETLVADSSTSTGLRYQGNYAAGKNVILNSDFRIAQRGTSFTSLAFGTYTLDRWLSGADGSPTRTVSQQTFTPGAAPVAGYEGSNFMRIAQTVAGSGGTFNIMEQRVEDVRTFAGQTITFSFWGKAAANTTISYSPEQVFGTGGSSVVANTGANFNLTTSWQRFTATTTLASISGKTIGTGSYLNVRFVLPLNTTFTVDIWGVQVEAGSVATAFQTATGTLQGELAACQRYYWRSTAVEVYAPYGLGYAHSTTNGTIYVQPPVQMRVRPTSVDFSNLSLGIVNVTGFPVTSLAISTADSGTHITCLNCTTAGTLTQFRSYGLNANNTTSSFVGLSAEL